jgi:hypothetical protein
MTVCSDQCKKEFCSGLCIKQELGDDEAKKGAWTAMFARAPMNPDACLEACYSGCQNLVQDD